LVEALNFIAGYLCDSLNWNDGKGSFLGQHWENTGHSMKGMRWFWNPPEGKNLGHALISLPGGALANISCRDQWRLCSGLLNKHHLKITRTDIAMDDFKKRVSFEDVQTALANKNYARFKVATATKNYGGEYQGFTCKFGSRAGDRMMRFYDKHAESKGEIDSYRWELELKDELAHKAILDWMKVDMESFEDISPKYLAGLVVGSYDFVERGKEKNISRMPRLEWWEKLCDAVAVEIRHSIARVKTTLELAKKWIGDQVAPTIAIIRKVLGVAKFNQWIDDERYKSEKRFNRDHYTKLQQWKQELEFEGVNAEPQ
jgi:DNA relaxase NicK